MTTFIETLNLWGDYFLKFAWPVLWQSSLLIAIIFVLEFALRRKIRTAIRYALWLMVLVKLLLPPSLALPLRRPLEGLGRLVMSAQSMGRRPSLSARLQAPPALGLL